MLPLRNSATFFPLSVSNTLINVPFSLAVAKRVPCKLSAIQLIVASCATISNGALSVFARSTIY